jgi:predicted metal-dependent hydrolase
MQRGGAMDEDALRSSLTRGVALFNEGRFWHAHEAWEEAWLGSQGDLRQFLQGLIQLAAAYHHVQRGTFSGGIRLFAAALDRLHPFPPGHLGVERSAVVQAAILHRERIRNASPVEPAEYPKFGS